MAERQKQIWILQVEGEENPRAVRATTEHRAWLHVAHQVVSEGRKATAEDGFRLKDVAIEDAKEN